MSDPSRTTKTVATPAESAERVIAYLQSDAGRAAMIESNRRVEETIALLRKSRDIPQELLHAPFTI